MVNICLCQVNNNQPKEKIFIDVLDMVNSDKSIDMIVLPECFNAPYGSAFFDKHAEFKDGDTHVFLQKLAKDNNAYVVGGSIIVKMKDKLFNTCFVFDRKGNEIGSYSKIHLFDIDLPKKKFKESDTLSPGNKPLILCTDFGHVGIGICFDLRFSKLAEFYRENNCSIIVYPGAFTMPTGKLHYELLLRGRALDNQLYVIGCAPSRDETASYVTWSNSTVVNPFGEVILNLGHKQNSASINLDMNAVINVRKYIPITDTFKY
jgi:omega-amidase